LSDPRAGQFNIDIIARLVDDSQAHHLCGYGGYHKGSYQDQQDEQSKFFHLKISFLVLTYSFNVIIIA
jgi:hypothetical protein